ncbi:MAG: cytochrome C oxidase subunit IV family protein [Planctomycetota bacterium]|jgi:cytochrome c oxidase subunit 4
MSSSATAHTDPGHIHKHHVSSVFLLGAILAVLLVLTGLTVAVSRIDLGGTMNLIVAVAIACVKAGLVIAFFMHLAHDKPLNAVLVFYTLLTVATFFVFTIIDLSSRGAIDPIREQTLVEPPMAADAIAEGHGDDHQEGTSDDAH